MIGHTSYEGRTYIHDKSIGNFYNPATMSLYKTYETIIIKWSNNTNICVLVMNIHLHEMKSIH